MALATELKSYLDRYRTQVELSDWDNWFVDGMNRYSRTIIDLRFDEFETKLRQWAKDNPAPLPLWNRALISVTDRLAQAETRCEESRGSEDTIKRRARAIEVARYIKEAVEEKINREVLDYDRT